MYKQKVINTYLSKKKVAIKKKITREKLSQLNDYLTCYKLKED